MSELDLHKAFGIKENWKVDENKLISNPQSFSKIYGILRSLKEQFDD